MVTVLLPFGAGDGLHTGAIAAAKQFDIADTTPALAAALRMRRGDVAGDDNWPLRATCRSGRQRDAQPLAAQLIHPAASREVHITRGVTPRAKSPRKRVRLLPDHTTTFLSP